MHNIFLVTSQTDEFMPIVLNLAFVSLLMWITFPGLPFLILNVKYYFLPFLIFPLPHFFLFQIFFISLL